uniref:Serpin domain-containing protein n=1 Tax=Panagrolaimus superbus TaxID=310955 RepID=A0A914Z4F1_9BILA
MFSDFEINFTIEILKLLNADNKPNAFSPMSIFNSLAIILAGSEGPGANQICTVIGKGKSRDAVIKNYASLINFCKALNESAIGHVYCKNLFLSDEPFTSPAAEVMHKFDAEYKQLNFDADAFLREINDFVSQNTKNQINNCITNKDVSLMKKSVTIVNALYVDHIWDNPFTYESLFQFLEPPFKHYSVRKTRCIFRQIENEGWNLTQGENWKCLGIPYKSRKTWIHILLPNEYGDLNELLQKFDVEMFKKCIAKQAARKMKVIIPVFEVETKICLNEILNKLGFTDIFNAENVSNILSHPCYVNNFFHSTKINVNQTGLETPFYMNLTKEERFKLAEEQEYEPEIDFEGWKRLEREERDEDAEIEDLEIERFNANHPFIYFVTLVNDSVEDLKTIITMGKYC